MDTNAAVSGRLQQLLSLLFPLRIFRSRVVLGRIDGTTHTEQIAYQAAHLLPANASAEKNVLGGPHVNLAASKSPLRALGHLAKDVRPLVMV
jgi:hypothetical protein